MPERGREIDRERERVKKCRKYIALHDEHLEIPSEGAAGRELGENCSNCVCWLGGCEIDRASCVSLIIPLKKELGFEG